MLATSRRPLKSRVKEQTRSKSTTGCEKGSLVELTGCAALCRCLLRELLEHLRVLGVRRQVQQPCRVVVATKQKPMSVAGCSIASEGKHSTV